MLIVSAFALTNCASVTDKYDRTLSHAVIMSCPLEKPFFAYKKLERTEVHIQPTDTETETHRLFRISFPSIMPGITVMLLYWQSKAKSPVGVVIAVPIVDGPRYPSDHITDVLTTWNRPVQFHAVTLEWKGRVFDPPPSANAFTEKTVLAHFQKERDKFQSIIIDLRRALDWIEYQPEIDASRIGIAGGSLGALIASLMMGVDSRIHAGFFMLGSGDLPAIFTYGTSDLVKPLREAVYTKLLWSKEKYKRVLARIFQKIDPLTYAGCINPEKVLIIDAKNDEYFSRQTSTKLWNAMGRPTRMTIQSMGHKTAFLAMTPVGGWVADFKWLEHFERELR